MRVMMIGAYPQSSERIDGGVSAAMTYLSHALAANSEIELIGARITAAGDESGEDRVLGWPVANIVLGRMALASGYRRQMRRLQELLLRYRPDIVHGQGVDIAGFLAVGCGLPAVITVHGLLGECAKYQSNSINKLRATLAARLTEKRTIRRAADLIAISPYVAQYYSNDIRGRVHDIPNPVAPAFFQVIRAPERGRLLYAGRIANGKGLLDLLRAVAGDDSRVTKLVLAGAVPDPAYGELLRREAATFGLADRIHFAGLLSESHLLKEFRGADALVLPSYQETAPMVVQQAMAAGIPVIATTVGGIPQQIEHEATGLLFEAGDVDRLTNLITRLVQNPDLARRLGEAAKAVAVSRYPAKSVAQATVSVYRSALGRNGVRA